MKKNLVSLIGLAALLACSPSGPRPEGLGETQRSGGPVVVWDVAAEPLPEIPLPNDAATRLDPASPTGRRINVSLDAAKTRYERRTRKLFNRLDGFGAYAPISVRFDKPLDLADLLARHRENDDFRDDALYVVNVDRSCKRFGEEIALDVGRGRFPITLMSRSARVADPKAPFGYRLDEEDNKLFPFDPKGESLNVLFPDFTEDKNKNGVLDPGEDLDGDGRLGEANFLDPHACDAVPPSTPAHDRCVADNLLTWYERSTNTLTLRPVWPLEERCAHAVVLTKRLRGADGKPVESPFPTVQPVDQIAALAPLRDLLPRYGLTTKDVAFAWSFTVGTMTKDLEAVRAGLYGHGPLARLGKEFPASGFDVWTRNQWREILGLPALTTGGEARSVSGGCTTATFAALAGTGDGDKQICGGYGDLAAIGTMFGGTFSAPNFLVDKDGMATSAYPADEDETFDLDAEAGRATYGKTDVTFFCALPREDAKPAGITCTPGNPEGKPWCKPYPVVLFAHGYGSFKGEFVLLAGRHAQMGMAGCGIDSYGHGRRVVFTPGCPGYGEFLLGKAKLGEFGVPEAAAMIYWGRDRDLNNDGCPDGGADQWTANLFHTRDIVRQSVLEEMQFVRMLHAMDGATKDKNGNVLGDVDGDGQVDLGGPKNTAAAWGISLGGQLTAVLAGAEPTLDVTVPNAVGAGLTDISVRLGQGGLAEAVMLPVQGPVLVGCLPTDPHQNPLTTGQSDGPCVKSVPDGASEAGGAQRAGELLLSFYLHDNARFASRVIARVPGVAVGDVVRVDNLDKGTSTRGRVGARGFVRLNVAADALSPVQRRSVLGFGDDDNSPKQATDTTRLGDRLRVTVLDGSTGAVKTTVDRFSWDVAFQGTVYPKDQPLVALQEGLGYQRNTSDFRRFYGIAQHAITQADPAVWSHRYFEDPIEAPYDPAWWKGRGHVMVMPTIGDSQVPAATGVALGRTAGLLGSWTRDESIDAKYGWRALFSPDARYGKSIDRWLLDNYVVEGDWRMQRWASWDKNPNVLYDPDDNSDGKAAFSCDPAVDWSADNGEFRCPEGIKDTPATFTVPRPEPGKALRRDRPRADGTFDAFRIPLQRPSGQHGIYNPQPFRAFDADAYMVSFVARYMASRAKNLKHEAGCDCAYAQRPLFEVDGAPAWPGIESVPACPDADTAYGKACSPTCAAAWGLTNLPKTVCKR
jgi:hypothetical protein